MLTISDSLFFVSPIYVYLGQGGLSAPLGKAPATSAWLQQMTHGAMPYSQGTSACWFPFASAKSPLSGYPLVVAAANLPPPAITFPIRILCAGVSRKSACIDAVPAASARDVAAHTANQAHTAKGIGAATALTATYKLASTMNLGHQIADRDRTQTTTLGFGDSTNRTTCRLLASHRSTCTSFNAWAGCVRLQ